MARPGALAMILCACAPASTLAGKGQLRGSSDNSSIGNSSIGSNDTSLAAASLSHSPYILQVGYSCPAGYQHLESPSECEQAAKRIVPNGFSLTIDYNTPSSSFNPQYCYVFGSYAGGFTNLYWNPGGATSGSWDSRNVICKQASVPSVWEGAIQWATYPSKCLDVAGGHSYNGNRIQLWDCQWSDNQKFLWEGNGGKIRWATNPSKCLDVPGGQATNGNRIQLWDCHTSSSAQAFNAPFSGSGKIQWATQPSKCVDVSNGGTQNGNAVQLWDCNVFPYVDSTRNQRFTVPR